MADALPPLVQVVSCGEWDELPRARCPRCGARVLPYRNAGGLAWVLDVSTAKIGPRGNRILRDHPELCVGVAGLRPPPPPAGS